MKLQSDLCDPSDAYVVANEKIGVAETNDANRRNSVIFKNNLGNAYQKSITRSLIM